MNQIPFQISDNSLTFFAHKSVFTVASDHANFAKIAEGLLRGHLDADTLCELADIRIALSKSTDGRISVFGDAVTFDGIEIHNVWVDKLFGFIEKDLPTGALVEALASLMRNPSEKARERLPIFIEQSQLGFLPDGRIAALKVVRGNFRDVYTGTFDNTPGQIVHVDWQDVDPNPDHECSTGLHLGAYRYLPSYGLHDPGKRVVLCAFWPEDVVAVPRDYHGQKMRVCRYEVLQEMDKANLIDFIDANQTTINQYWGTNEIRIDEDKVYEPEIDGVEIQVMKERELHPAEQAFLARFFQFLVGR
ncbi:MULTISPECIES: hypothetical protein [unclassified Beijerinckia]|uniref:hypothetical protein n=1 Tax=unclassified Beijerinckia TaxID=2638183 RepID=UPI000897201D|nr:MULTISPECIES: hypothetical protein [unclassified Beijerinckia]MDH7796369.1 hypothetical protein [Beijerinckia sp. GAS462]SEC42176.1 hypothetical protein SAMN05443249_2652 [Beijerinckia sp. 28-YEA-48]